MFYRISVYLIGIIINFLGVTLVINASLGAGFWTAFFEGVSNRLGGTIGVWYATFQFIIIFINAQLMKQSPEFRAILVVVLESIILDFWVEIVFANVDLSQAPLTLQLLVLTIGALLIGLGVAIYILPLFPRAPVDQLFLAVSHRLQLSLRMGQTLVAVVMSTLALLVGGPVGIGTLVLTLFLGPITQFFYVRAYPIYYKYGPEGHPVPAESFV